MSEDSWGSTPHKFDTWIYAKIGFLTTWFPGTWKKGDSLKTIQPWHRGVAKTRYCLMIITEFGYKARSWHGWICVIFRFQATSWTHMSCRIVLCRFIWWTKMDELHQNFMPLPSPLILQPDLFKGNMCWGTDSISTKLAWSPVGWLCASSINIESTSLEGAAVHLPHVQGGTKSLSMWRYFFHLHGVGQRWRKGK